METASTLAELGRLVGHSKGYLSKLSKRDWWPAGGPPYDVEAIRVAIRANVVPRPPSKKPQNGTATRGPGRPAAPRATVDYPQELLEVLRSGSEDPVEVARAALGLVSRRLAAGLDQQLPGAKDVEDLKKALGELRAAEKDYLDLEARRGELIDRSVAADVAGQLGQRLVGILTSCEALLATQVEIWLGDEEFRGFDVTERRRRVQEWFHRQARALREVGADELERMLKET